MSAISTVKAPFGAQRHSEIFERHLNFESATSALKRQIWQPWLSNWTCLNLLTYQIYLSRDDTEKPDKAEYNQMFVTFLA